MSSRNHIKDIYKFVLISAVYKIDPNYRFTDR